MADFKYEVQEILGTLGERTDTGWQKKVTRISWNDRPAKIDIRPWNDDMSKMSKGVSLDESEWEDLKELILGGKGFGDALVTDEDLLNALDEAR